jgi:hypothetical protein
MIDMKVFGFKSFSLKQLLFVSVLLIFLILLFLISFLPLNGSIDYVVYNQCLTGGSYPDFEPGMNLFCSFTAQFDPFLAVLIARFFSLVVLVLATYFIGRRFGITSSLFFLLLNGFQMLGAYRQGWSTIFLCFAILAIVEKKKIIRGWLSLLTAISFHFSSILIFFIVLYAKFAKIWISIVSVLALLYFESLIGLFFGLEIIPDNVLYRYIALSKASLPSNWYLELGKLWYLIYYFVFLIILFKYFRDNRSDNLRKIYIAFLPLIIAVPILTIMDSWIATRLSSLTNPVELLFFVKSATRSQKLFMLISYTIRTGIAFLSFFIFNGAMFN